jgi:hypothetical protein
MLHFPTHQAVPDNQYRNFPGLILDGREVRQSTNRMLSEGDYEQRMFDLLTLVGARNTGQHVLGRISQICAARQLRVRIANTWPDRNAHTNPTYEAAGTPSSNANRLIAQPRRGSSVNIRFSPIDQWGPTGRPAAGNTPDEVLLHELVHAWMILNGASSVVAVGRFDIVDDFFAVMIANMYASERGRPLRRDHSGWAPMSAQEAQEVPQRLGRYITAFARVLPQERLGLAQVRAPFNPFLIQ